MRVGTTEAIVLATLADGPLTTREISESLYHAILDAWKEKHGYDFKWGTRSEPVGARLLACGEARDLGLRFQTWDIRPLLTRLERRGLVQRIQIEGHRPMLWRLT